VFLHGSCYLQGLPLISQYRSIRHIYACTSWYTLQYVIIYIIVYTMIYQYTNNTMVYDAPMVYIIYLKRPTAKAHSMMWAFSFFHPEDCPVLSGIMDFKSSKSTTESWYSQSQPLAVKPKRRCCMFHFVAVRWTSISLSHGSSTSCNLYRGKSGPAA
jgi:hypothetical protein